MLTQALWYAQHGIAVFPLRERGKEPLTKSGFHEATTDESTIRDWWTRWPEANIGAPTGRQFDVIDVDGPTGQESIRPFLASLPIIGKATTRRADGLHLFVPPTGLGNKVSRSLYPGVDYRGKGGYVVLAPSFVDQEGVAGTYRWSDLLDFETGDQPNTEHPFYAPWRETPVATGLDGVADAIETYVDHEAEVLFSAALGELLSTADGSGRNHALNLAAFKAGTLVAAGRLDEARARERLAVAAEHAGLSAREIPRTIDSGMSAGKANPREEDQKQERKIQLTPASRIRTRPVVWAWEDRLPAGALSIAAGREGTGKSQFAAWLAAKITRGTLEGSMHKEPRAVFYLAVEDSWEHTLAPRLEAAGADMDRVYRLEVTEHESEDGTMLSLPSDNQMLVDAVEQYNAGLVVFDPLMSCIDAVIDTHRNREVRKALDPLARIATKTGAVFLGIAHFNKSAGSDVSALISGSGAFKDVPRAILGFVKSEDGSRRVMTQTKNSLGRDDLPSIEYEIQSCTVDTEEGPAHVSRWNMIGQSEETAMDLIRESHAPRSRGSSASDFVIRWVREHGGRAIAGQVFEAATEQGHSRDSVRKAKDRLHGNGTLAVDGTGDSAVWSFADKPRLSELTG